MKEQVEWGVKGMNFELILLDDVRILKYECDWGKKWVGYSIREEKGVVE
ncbi:hypothetical protein [Bacillus subtilis]|nr:hypothetical protein [Bacillus subtilis]